MTVLRSLLFAPLFYCLTTAWVILALPTLLLPYEQFVQITVRNWARSCLWLFRIVCGVTVELRGEEHIPPGALIFASKHQSAWETMFFAAYCRRPVYVAKRELLFIPFFGWYLWKSQQIMIDRGRGAAVVAALNRQAAAAMDMGRQLIIFPEGTRRPVGAEPAYKSGVSHLYRELGVPCVPVALNAGLFWPRRTFLKYPGRLVVEFLPPIVARLPRDAFMTRLSDMIETATDRLVAESAPAKA